jgi:predicted transcriptional regulator
MGKFTLEFGPKSTARLEEIAKTKELSRADVVRRALEVYSDLLDATRDNGKVILQSKDGGTKEIVSL